MEQNFTISLKAARVNAGLTLEQAGEAVGRNKNTILNWEVGNTRISREDFVELCKIYEIPESMVKNPQK